GRSRRSAAWFSPGRLSARDAPLASVLQCSHKAGCKAGLKQVAACGSVPVQHFTAALDAGKLLQRQIALELRPVDPTITGNYFIQRTKAGYFQGKALDIPGKYFRCDIAFPVERLEQPQRPSPDL